MASKVSFRDVMRFERKPPGLTPTFRRDMMRQFDS
jgi:hypothetical protein